MKWARPTENRIEQIPCCQNDSGCTCMFEQCEELFNLYKLIFRGVLTHFQQAVEFKMWRNEPGSCFVTSSHFKERYLDCIPIDKEGSLHVSVHILVFYDARKPFSEDDTVLL